MPLYPLYENIDYQNLRYYEGWYHCRAGASPPPAAPPRPPHACRSREAPIRLVFAPFVTLKTIVHRRTFSKLNLQHLHENDVGRHLSVSNYLNISTIGHTITKD